MAGHPAPVSTYRLQLTPDFGFAEAAGIGGYLADLGVTHVYLSPVLQAVPGSAHGYDITDHSRIRAEFGGEDGFRAMARVLRGHGIGIVVDIVPNHMAVPVPESLNRQLWSVLREGPGAPHANWFDIDWAARGGRMLLPVLAGPPGHCHGDLAVDPAGPFGEPVLRYFGHVFPLRPGTARLPLADLLAAQHYELADWRTAATDLNWRRFFDVTSLIGVRVEDPAVFNATHEVTARLIGEGLIDGLRVDHPDGLADPRGYLRRLADLSGGRWTVAEKILSGDERLPADWPCAGTTGYDALGLVGGLFTEPAAGDALTSEYVRFACRAGVPGAATRFAGVATAAKREVAVGPLAAEVTRLARLTGDVRPWSGEDKRAVLAEVLAAFGVYRAYAHPAEPAPAASAAAVRSAVAAARCRLPRRLHALADAIGEAALDGSREFSARFQQTTGPVLAKGVEDTAFYRWPRLIALNEVGGDPDRLGVSPAWFHAEAARLAADWPATMTTLSTHDTKRQEDVRARLAVLAEIPGEWGRHVAAWHERAVRPGARTDSASENSASEDSASEDSASEDNAAAVDVEPETEYLIWQTLAGAWPLSAGRLAGYLTKAIREAKTRTSWTAPDAGYEAAVLGLAARILGDADLTADIGAFVNRISAAALANSLGAKLVQLTMAGVADTYQGCELTALALVDPDNRRPVDYARRRELLAELAAGGPPLQSGAGTDPDRAKLLVTSCALRLRRDHPDWFTGGDYFPLTVTGPAAEHAVAFGRGTGGSPGALTVVTRLPVGLRRRGGWGDTALALPPGGWRDVLGGSVLSGRAYQRQAPLADLTRRLPVALLIAEDRKLSRRTGDDRLQGVGAQRAAGRRGDRGDVAPDASRPSSRPCPVRPCPVRLVDGGCAGAG